MFKPDSYVSAKFSGSAGLISFEPVQSGLILKLVPAILVSNSALGSAGQTFTQTAPAASWTFRHNLGRLPAVEVYVGNEIVLTNVTADNEYVYVVFAQAYSGFLLVT